MISYRWLFGAWAAISCCTSLAIEAGFFVG